MSDRMREFWRMKSMLKSDGVVRFVDERETRNELIDLMPSGETRKHYRYYLQRIRETVVSEDVIEGEPDDQA